MITEQDKSAIRYLLQSQQWKAVERIVELLVNKIMEGSAIRETEWETIKEFMMREGQVQGIRRLIKELYVQAHDET